MTNARSLANFATGIGTEGAVLTVDNTNNRIGIATTNPQNDLQVGAGITMEGDPGDAVFAGVVTATSFVGDGTGLTGVASTDNINTSTLAQFAGGVGIADSIFHLSDDNTAIRFPAADTFTVTTSGSERLRINSVGQISIRGTTTAFDTTGDLDSLQLYYETDSGQASIGPYSSGGSTHLSFYTNSGAAAATEKLRITSGGLVGIGTDNPIFKLQVDHADEDGILLKTANTAASFINFSDGDDNDVGQISYDHATNHLAFKVNATERLRITSGGLVGIGTNNPGTSLEVFTDDDTDISDSTGTNNTNSILRLWNKNGSDGTGVNNYTGIRFDVANGARSSAYLNYVRTGDNQGAFLFKARNAASSYPELLRITSAGNVAIGTITPNSYTNYHALTINGAVGGEIDFEVDSTLHADIFANGSGYNLTTRVNDLPIIFHTTNSGGTFAERMRIAGSGRIGIGTGDPDTTLHLMAASPNIQIEDSDNAAYARIDSSNGNLFIKADEGNSQATSFIKFYVNSSHAASIYPGGDFEVIGVATATQWDATSDVSLKENIEVIDEPITKLSELKGVTFDWKKGGHSVGVIAQDVEKVLPTAVGGSKDQKTVNYNAIIGLLVESVKDQQKQIEELKSSLDK